MLIRINSAQDVKESETTPRSAYMTRRRILAAAGMGVASLVAPAVRAAGGSDRGLRALSFEKSRFGTIEKPTSVKDVTTYNNFYEFGTEKSDPAAHAGKLKVLPWTVKIEGEVGKPGTWGIEDLLKVSAMEERIYRMRCVEGWSMVIPWVGYSLAELIRRVEPNSRAKYVEFVTLADPAQMPGLSYPVLQWPYVEALRIDEAMHPLTLLTFGLYGQVLPNQNGAPVRLIVPWKYGFKSGKSLVSIRFTEERPATSWNVAAPTEYGFFSNVNPLVDHPRWSQATERRIGEDGFLSRKRKSLMFNGYADQVASLYDGMDLGREF